MTPSAPTHERLGNGLHVLRTEARIPHPIDDVFAFFAAAENLERITPPALRFRIVTPTPVVIRAGTLIDYRLRLNGIPFGWRTEITEWEPPHSFTDTQLRGPYHTWIHRHTFRADGDATEMHDEVRYRLPMWPLGEVALPVVRRRIDSIFRYRATVLESVFG